MQLRPLEFQPLRRGSEALLLLRDPLQLSEQRLLLPQALAPVLAACQRGVPAAQLAECWPDDLGPPAVDDLLDQLDGAHLLANERAAQARATQTAAFRQLPARPLAHAGRLYPAKANLLADLFARRLAAAGDPASDQPCRGLLSPHLDYERGGAVYAAAWQTGRSALATADLVVILGTDHWGRPGGITLTSLPFATPFGQLPAAPELVSDLAAALGPALRADELHHRYEHAIELNSNWLGYLAGQGGPPLLPVLCGPVDWADDKQLAQLDSFATHLRTLMAGQRVLYVASVDLAHVGPAFGEVAVEDAAWRDREAERLGLLQQVDAAGWRDHLAATANGDQVCGASALYLFMRLLGKSVGERLRYETVRAGRDGRVACAAMRFS